MTRSWLRFLVSALIIVAALSGAASRGLAMPSGQACAGMASMDDCPDGHHDHAAIPRHCDSLVCGAVQLTAVAVAAYREPALADRPLHPLDDLERRSLAGSPDLRPPIS